MRTLDRVAYPNRWKTWRRNRVRGIARMVEAERSSDIGSVAEFSRVRNSTRSSSSVVCETIGRENNPSGTRGRRQSWADAQGVAKADRSKPQRGRGCVDRRTTRRLRNWCYTAQLAPVASSSRSLRIQMLRFVWYAPTIIRPTMGSPWRFRRSAGHTTVDAPTFAAIVHLFHSGLRLVFTGVART